MKHYIVDAHNVIHKHPTWRRLAERRQVPEARQALANAVGALAARYPSFFFTLVFDGKNADARAPYRNIAVYAAPQGVTADAIIKRRIDADPQPRSCVVVSSDTEVHNYARRSGCAVMAASEFLNELAKPHLDKTSEEFYRRKFGGEEKPASPSKSDIEEFKRLFNQ